MTALETVVLHPFKDDEASGECDACGLQPEDHPPAKPTCHVDLWTSNLRTLIEVYCSRHGLLGQVPFSDAVTLRDEHMSTGGAPVTTGPDASPDTMVSSLDICGDVAVIPPGAPEMCRRPSGHHGAHVAWPSNPAESMWWRR